MVGACGAAAEPDIELTVAPRVPRRVLGAAPVATLGEIPTSHPAPPPTLSPPPVPSASPPPVPAAAVVAPASVPSGDDGDEPRPGGRLDRRAVTSAATSFVVHVVVLTVLALIVSRPDAERRPRPLEVTTPPEQAEPFDLADLDEQPAVEVVPPEAEEPVADLVEPLPEVAGAEIEADVADVTAAAFDPGGDGVAGIAAMDDGDFLARVGGGPARGPAGGGGGAGAAGFGGDIGRRLARAGARTGDVQVSLAWNNLNDIDLHVITPRGEHISFANRQSTCRGMLDVDMNAGWQMSREPVENVFWPANAAPVGVFEVYVHHYAMHDRIDATPFEVHVLVDGEKRTYTGSVQSGDGPVLVTRLRRDRQRPEPAASAGSDEFVE